MRRATLIAVALAAAGCADLPTPAELTHPQILAVRAEPPGLAEGGRAELSILIAGPDGAIDDAEVAWQVTSPTPELPAIGEIEIDGDGRVWYVPPERVGKLSITTVQATARIAGSPDLVALKGVGVGLPRDTDNPVIDELLADGQPVADGTPITVGTGQPLALDVQVSPEPTDDASYSWYATLGEIELYRRTPTELVGPAQPGEGTLYLVYRDGRGGIAWRSVGLVVE